MILICKVENITNQCYYKHTFNSLNIRYPSTYVHVILQYKSLRRIIWQNGAEKTYSSVPLFTKAQRRRTLLQALYLPKRGGELQLFLYIATKIYRYVYYSKRQNEMLIYNRCINIIDIYNRCQLDRTLNFHII